MTICLFCLAFFCLCFLLPLKQEHESLASSNSLGPDSITQDHTYLSSEKDVALWKTLTASPNNCNIFVGGLHHGVVSQVLHTAFKAFCLKEEDEKKMKVELCFGQKIPVIKLNNKYLSEFHREQREDFFLPQRYFYLTFLNRLGVPPKTHLCPSF